MTRQARAVHLFALLSTACTIAPDVEPTRPDGDVPTDQISMAASGDANDSNDVALSCVITHAEGLFDVYAHAPETGDTFELSLDEMVLGAQQFLQFNQGAAAKLLTLNGSSTGSFSKTVLIDGTVLRWSEGDSNSTTIDVADGQLTGSANPVLWFRIVRSGNYVSHARAECAELK